MVVDPNPGLHGEAGIDLLQLGGGVLCLPVVACQGGGGGEDCERKENLWLASRRLAAPCDRFFPLRKLRVEGAHI